jgi:hypothetical protein
MDRTEGAIDLTGWTLGFGHLDKTVVPEVAAALEAMLSAWPPELYLLSNGDIELVLEGLSHLGENEPTWQTPLAALVEDRVKRVSLPDGSLDPQARESLEETARALEAAAARVRRALR